MPDLSRELLFILLKFMDEEKFKDTVHEFERESGIFLNQKYVEELVMAGKLDEAERYLLGFSKIDENMHSVKLFFEIRMQKYMEALNKKDLSKAVEILVKDLKQFKDYNTEHYKDITHLLTFDNFGENDYFRENEVRKSQRTVKWLEIKKLIEANPVIQPKLTFPAIPASRFRTLMNQSLHWQHHTCKNPRPNPDIRTLFVDHTCEPPNGLQIQKGVGFPPIATHIPGVTPTASTPTGWMVNNNHPVPHDAVATGGSALVPPPNAGPRPPPHPCNKRMEYQFADTEHITKHSQAGQGDEVTYLGKTHPSNMYSKLDPPKTVARSLDQCSNVVSMDFHPRQQTVLLVGTDVGDIEIWEVGSCEKLAHKSFKVGDASNCTAATQVALSKESAVSVNQCIWSPNGELVGVAFSKHIVHIYSYIAVGKLKQQLQIDAHTGGVNDIAFVHPKKQLYVVTCGDDMTIKVWDAETGHNQYIFEGHTAPVYSVCPNHKENIQFILSTTFDGKIRVWLFGHSGNKIDYDAPGHGCTKMAYSDDGSRLFSCGTNKQGESYLVEWNENDGAVKWRYSGLQSQSSELVKFDTTKNRFLAAGDEYQIKFWDMNNINIFSTTSVGGCLPARPHLRFNKEGFLLAVTTRNNGVKILANSDGLQFLRRQESNGMPPESVVKKDPHLNPICAANGIGPVHSTPENFEKNLPEVLMVSVDNNRMMDVKQRIPDECVDKRKNWKFYEVTDPVQCRSIRLLDPLSRGQIARLLYRFSGSCLLALDTSATHQLWNWQCNEQNPSGKATTNVLPRLWQPPSGILMRNDTSDRGPEEVNPCIALSDNDEYLLSASGGQVSLFRMDTFEVMAKCMVPPPAATFIAFNPLDNNIVAVGMEDSTIQIFNVPFNEVKSKLKGHQKRITGLVFSKNLNVLVSSGADAQLCVWHINGWERHKSKPVHTQATRSSSLPADTRVQFDKDQVHLLVVQESQIAIYDASELECVCHWAPQDPMLACISSATYSCDNLLVYASFYDGSVGVFDAKVLRPHCRIAPSVFIPGMGSGNIYPLVIAANPLVPNQFAVGFTDGSVHVIEPSESEGKWVVGLLDNGGTGSSHTIRNQGFELPSR